MKTIAIRLSDDLLSEVHHVAKKRGATRSVIMRETLEGFFAKEKREILGSCLDTARDTCRKHKRRTILLLLPPDIA